MDGLPVPRRRGFVAVVLSLLCTGLGHLYVGRVRRGLLLFAASLLLPPALLLTMALPPSVPALGLLVAVVLAWPVLVVFAAADSARIARRRGEEWRPGEVNHAAVYGLLALIGLCYPLGSTMLLREHAVQAFKLPTRSMEPTVRPGDRILVDKLTYRLREPERFDLVVFRAPGDRRRFFIKRIVGLPGDRVEMEEGRLRLNGEEVPLAPAGGSGRWLEGEGAAGHPILSTGRERISEVEVPRDCYYVLGDNRTGSRDSRDFGPVPRGDLLGPARYLFWPPGPRFGVLR